MIYHFSLVHCRVVAESDKNSYVPPTGLSIVNKTDAKEMK